MIKFLWSCFISFDLFSVCRVEWRCVCVCVCGRWCVWGVGVGWEGVLFRLILCLFEFFVVGFASVLFTSCVSTFSLYIFS